MELRSATRARSISSIINDDLFSEELRREITTITRPTRVLLKDLNFPSMTNLLSDRGDFYSNANSPDSSDDETVTTTLVTKHRPSNVNIDTIRPLELMNTNPTNNTHKPKGNSSDNGGDNQSENNNEEGDNSPPPHRDNPGDSGQGGPPTPPPPPQPPDGNADGESPYYKAWMLAIQNLEVNNDTLSIKYLTLNQTQFNESYPALANLYPFMTTPEIVAEIPTGPSLLGLRIFTNFLAKGQPKNIQEERLLVGNLFLNDPFKAFVQETCANLENTLDAGRRLANFLFNCAQTLELRIKAIAKIDEDHRTL